MPDPDGPIGAFGGDGEVVLMRAEIPTSAGVDGTDGADSEWQLLTVPVPSPLEQARLVHAAIDGEASRLALGDHWFVVAIRWWDLWKTYAHYDDESSALSGTREVRCGSSGSCDLPSPSEQPPLRRQSSSSCRGKMPPEVDNSDLTVGHESERLQRGLLEDRDFVLLPERAWRLLWAWYGGGPVLRRRVVSQGAGGELLVELYPLCLDVCRVDSGGHPEHSSKVSMPFSRADTAASVLRAACETWGIGPDEKLHRLWYRGSVEVDQTDIDTLEGWDQLQPLESSLEDLCVVDGASVLLEVASVERARGHDTAYYSTAVREAVKWPFFRRMRIDYKRHQFKDPRSEGERLAVDDLIDAQADCYDRGGCQKTWFAATVVEEDDTRILLQFHNRPKPQGSKRLPPLFVEEELAIDDILVGQTYEGKDSQGAWPKITITAFNSDGTLQATHNSCGMKWPVVFMENVRRISQFTPEVVEALKKVFNRYASDGRIEVGGLRGLISCATNEMVEEGSKKISDFLKAPFGDGSAVEFEGFLAYWSAKRENEYFLKQQLQRLFDRAGARLSEQTEYDKLLEQGREWIDRGSDRLAQYRSHTAPEWDSRNFRDFKRYSKLDVKFGAEWKEAEVRETNWEEMTVLVEILVVQGQREWIPMESARLAEYQTKSLEGPEDSEDPAPLLARSKSQGGVCVSPGACGLQNLGNTCFMNATLQCLSNTAALRAFFAGGPDLAPAFAAQVSASPLSMQGRLAREFSRVLRQMWSNTLKAVAPAQLKKLIGERRAEFSGYQQQDAHELLSFLLDGLHEDVNRAVYPRMVLDVGEGAGKKDEELASKMWEAHLKRNNSRIVEIFHFQIRSELECPECGNISVTFDPTMCLQLPVPTPPHSVKLTVRPLDYPATPMTEVAVEIPKEATFEELEARLWTLLARKSEEGRPSCFAFADVPYGERIFLFYEKSSRVGDIKKHEKVFAIETELAQNMPESAHTFVPIVFRVQELSTSPYSNQKHSYTQRCAPPCFVAVPEGGSNKFVRLRLSAMAARLLTRSPDPSSESFSVVTGLDVYAYSSGGTTIPEDDDRFTIPDNVGVNFTDAEAAVQMKQALPKAAPLGGLATGGTTLHQCLVKHAEREQLSEADSVFCGKCKVHRRQMKKLDIWSLPQVLIIHFKRFGRDSLAGPLTKNDIAIDFPQQLDLSTHLRCPCEKAAAFELFGVVNHGGSMGGGHYTAHARVTSTADEGSESGDWFSFNDSWVQSAAPEDVDPVKGYILFYRRMEKAA